jgi:hypothetical protein
MVDQSLSIGAVVRNNVNDDASLRCPLSGIIAREHFQRSGAINDRRDFKSAAFTISPPRQFEKSQTHINAPAAGASVGRAESRCCAARRDM